MAQNTDELEKMIGSRRPRDEKQDFSDLEKLDPVFRMGPPTFERNEVIDFKQAGLPESYQMVRKALFGESDIPKGFGELAGLGVGATAGTLEQGRNILNLLPAFRAASQTTSTPPTGSAYEKWLRNFAGMERTGPGGVPEAAQTYQRAKTHGEAGKKIFQRYGTQPLDISRYLEAAEEADRGRRAAGLSQMAQTTTKGLGYIPGLSILAGTVGGGDIVEAIRRLEKGDYPGAAIKGIGGLGALASLIPTPITRLGGGALGLLSLPLESMYQERMGQQQ